MTKKKVQKTTYRHPLGGKVSISETRRPADIGDALLAHAKAFSELAASIAGQTKGYRELARDLVNTVPEKIQEIVGSFQGNPDVRAVQETMLRAMADANRLMSEKAILQADLAAAQRELAELRSQTRGLAARDEDS